MVQLNFNQFPLSYFQREVQVQISQTAKVMNFSKGEVVWSNSIFDNLAESHIKQHGEALSRQSIFCVTKGRVRLIQMSNGRGYTLKAQDQFKPKDISECWFGDILQLRGEFQAVAMDKHTEIVQWNISPLWENAFNPYLERFWESLKAKYEPQISSKSVSTTQYPYYVSPDKTDTSATCLEMITEYLGCPVNYTKVQRELKGKDFRHIKIAAEKLGLIVEREESTWDDLQQIIPPMLFKWQGNQWVVIYEVHKNYLIVGNPASSTEACQRISRQLVEQSWDGIVLTFRAEPSSNNTFNLFWFLPAIWRYRTSLIDVLVASFAIQILGILSPLITRIVFDKAINQRNQDLLWILVAAMLGIALFELILKAVRSYTLSFTTRRLDLALSAQVVSHLLRLPVTFFDGQRVGDTVIQVQELERIRQFLSTILITVLDGGFAIFYLVIMFFLSAYLTGVSCFFLLIFVVLIFAFAPLNKKYLTETYKRRADSHSFLEESISGIHALKSHAVERYIRSKWEDLFYKYIEKGFQTSLISTTSSQVADFFSRLSGLTILLLGANLVIVSQIPIAGQTSGNIFTIGDFIAFQLLSSHATVSLLRLVNTWQDFQRIHLSIEQIGKILNCFPEVAPQTGIPMTNLEGRIEFDNVKYQYSAREKNTGSDQRSLVLEGLSFEVEPGQVIGIVGRSGSGKSTLSKLILGLYHPSSGVVRIDGTDLKAADFSSLRQEIAVVLQDDLIINASVADNIALGYENVEEREIVAAARKADAYEFIEKLPEGFNTKVGERGASLSGGQRQRIALARLFLSKAKIIILDEATSALDIQAEKKIWGELKEFFKGKTVFIITHKFYPLKDVDRILVLDKGKQVESGTHDELMEFDGLYKSMYQMQIRLT